MEPQPTAAASPLRPLWLVGDSLHADFVVETSWLREHGVRLPTTLNRYRYLCFGWGDRIAYTRRWRSADITQALFWPSESIVQVVGFNTPVRATFPHHQVDEVRVPASGGAQLVNFLEHSFTYASPQAAAPITLRPAKWGYGYFIKSPYSYYLPRMCNQWVSTALNAAGVHTTRPSMTMTSQSLAREVRRYQQ